MSVWDSIDQLKKKHAATAASLANAGAAYSFGTRASQHNAIHWVGRCRKQDCNNRDVVGTAEELSGLMKAHSDAHEAKKAKK